MQITLELIKKEQKEILRNLLEKYEYEFSQYTGDDINELGLFGYDYLDTYWNDTGRFPYFIKVDGKLAGFAMICDYPIADIQTDFIMSEFFVIYKYRGTGIAGNCVEKLLNMHQGKWALMFHPENIISKKFWLKTINKCTNGNYQQMTHEQVHYNGTPASILIFETN